MPKRVREITKENTENYYSPPPTKRQRYEPLQHALTFFNHTPIQDIKSLKELAKEIVQLAPKECALWPKEMRECLVKVDRMFFKDKSNFAVTLIKEAIKNNNPALVEEFFKLGVNASDPYSNAICQTVYKCSSPEILQFVMEKIGDEDWIDVLHKVCREGNITLAEWLLDVMLIDIQSLDRLGTPLLHNVVWRREAKMARWLIQRPDCPILQKDQQGNTVLHFLCNQGNPDLILVDQVIAKGGRPLLNAKNDNGDKPLHIAARWKTPIIHTLLEKGATVDLANNKGNSALHEACALGNRDAVIALLNHKARPYYVNLEGQTPVDVALLSEGGGGEVLQLLFPGWGLLKEAPPQEGGITFEFLQQYALLFPQRFLLHPDNAPDFNPLELYECLHLKNVILQLNEDVLDQFGMSLIKKYSVELFSYILSYYYRFEFSHIQRTPVRTIEISDEARQFDLKQLEKQAELLPEIERAKLFELLEKIRTRKPDVAIRMGKEEEFYLELEELYKCIGYQLSKPDVSDAERRKSLQRLADNSSQCAIEWKDAARKEALRVTTGVNSTFEQQVLAHLQNLREMVLEGMANNDRHRYNQLLAMLGKEFNIPGADRIHLDDPCAIDIDDPLSETLKQREIFLSRYNFKMIFEYFYNAINTRPTLFPPSDVGVWLGDNISGLFEEQKYQKIRDELKALPLEEQISRLKERGITFIPDLGVEGSIRADQRETYMEDIYDEENGLYSYNAILHILLALKAVKMV